MNDRAPNLILVTVDSLRRDRLGCYRPASRLTPNLTALARKCTLFTNAYSTAPNTPHAFPAILAGRYALQSSRLGLFDARTTLAEALQQSGYHTVAVNVANPYLTTFFRYDRGFDAFHDFLQMDTGALVASAKPREGSELITKPQLKVEEYLISEENLRRKQHLEAQLPDFLRELTDRLVGGPFFLWLHLMDTHYPYVPDSQAQKAVAVQPFAMSELVQLNQMVRENLTVSPSLLGRITELYHAAVFQADRQTGVLLQMLENKGLLENSVLLFTADHGEEFLEHGDLQHKSKLFEELTHVPLLLKNVGQTGAEFVHGLVSHVQIPATLRALAGIENAFGESDSLTGAAKGSDLQTVFAGASYLHQHMPPVDEHVFRINFLPKVFCSRVNRYKLYLDTGTHEMQLFDLFTDREERVNLIGRRPKLAAALRERLLQHIALLERQRLSTRLGEIRRKLAVAVP